MSFDEWGIRPYDGVRTDEFVLRPIVEADASSDHEAVMETREFLRTWEQSTWPEDDFSVEANREDMVKMEQRHLDNYAYGYTMQNPDESSCLGCVYVMPADAKGYADVVVEEVGSMRWADCRANVSFWVRSSRLDDGLDARLLAELVRWFDDEWKLDGVVFSTNRNLDRQVALFEQAGLQKQFVLELGDPAPTLAYA